MPMTVTVRGWYKSEATATRNRGTGNTGGYGVGGWYKRKKVKGKKRQKEINR